MRYQCQATPLLTIAMGGCAHAGGATERMTAGRTNHQLGRQHDVACAVAFCLNRGCLQKIDGARHRRAREADKSRNLFERHIGSCFSGKALSRDHCGDLSVPASRLRPGANGVELLIELRLCNTTMQYNYAIQ
jgi:hypothetical protein